MATQRARGGVGHIRTEARPTTHPRPAHTHLKVAQRLPLTEDLEDASVESKPRGRTVAWAVVVWWCG